jgi:hypothetical protein
MVKGFKMTAFRPSKTRFAVLGIALGTSVVMGWSGCRTTSPSTTKADPVEWTEGVHKRVHVFPVYFTGWVVGWLQPSYVQLDAGVEVSKDDCRLLSSFDHVDPRWADATTQVAPLQLYWVDRKAGPMVPSLLDGSYGPEDKPVVTADPYFTGVSFKQGDNLVPLGFEGMTTAHMAYFQLVGRSVWFKDASNKVLHADFGKPVYSLAKLEAKFVGGTCEVQYSYCTKTAAELGAARSDSQGILDRCESTNQWTRFTWLNVNSMSTAVFQNDPYHPDRLPGIATPM